MSAKLDTRHTRHTRHDTARKKRGTVDGAGLLASALGGLGPALLALGDLGGPLGLVPALLHALLLPRAVVFALALVRLRLHRRDQLGRRRLLAQLLPPRLLLLQNKN